MLACDVTRGAAVSRSAGEAGSRIVNMASRDLETPVSEEEYNVSDYSDSDFSVVERDSEGQIQPYMHGPTYNDNVEQNMIVEVWLWEMSVTTRTDKPLLVPGSPT